MRSISFSKQVVAVCLVLASLTGSASAQDADEPTETRDELKADLKGMIGLGLIGAELGFVIPALAGARGWWPYVVFPVIGAGGGAVGGYFLLEKGEGKPELAVAALTVGMALIIPALVTTVAATAYRPPEQIQSTAQLRARELARGGPGLVRYADGGLRLAPPAISAGPDHGAREALRTGEPRLSRVRVAVLSAQF
jgi:hypothetical protein